MQLYLHFFRVKDTFYLKYSYLLRSPWAPTLTEENMVISTMKETGYLLGPDRVLEVENILKGIIKGVSEKNLKRGEGQIRIKFGLNLY